MLSIVDHGDGFAVDLPLWLSRDGATSGQWIDRLSIRRGDGGLEFNVTEQGLALRLTGMGDLSVEAQDVVWQPRTGAADAFTEGGYSLSWDTNGRPLMRLVDGDVTVAWSYEGVSEDCSLFINHHISVAEPGWHSMEGSGRSPPPDCVE